MLAGFDVWREPCEHLTRIADERGINLYVFVDFSTVNLNMDFAGALGVGAQVASDAIIKTHAHGNEQVGFLNGVVDPSFAVHNHDAMAGEDDGAFGGVQHLHGAVEFCLVEIVAPALGGEFWHRRFPVEFSGSLLRVFGNVDKYRAGTSTLGD